MVVYIILWMLMEVRWLRSFMMGGEGSGWGVDVVSGAVVVLV